MITYITPRLPSTAPLLFQGRVQLSGCLEAKLCLILQFITALLKPPVISKHHFKPIRRGCKRESALTGAIKWEVPDQS